MTRSRKQQRRLLVGLLSGLGIGLLLTLTQWFDPLFLAQLDYHNRNLLYSPYPVSEHTVIVAVDDRTLNTYGRLGDWPRARHARLIETLRRAGTRVIAFDIAFVDADDDDPVLAAAIRQAGNVILPALGEGQPVPTDFGVTGYRQILRPSQSLAEAAQALAHANILSDRDTLVRRVPLLVEGEEQRYYALSLQVMTEFLNLPPPKDRPEQNHLAIRPGLNAPIDAESGMLINYAGPPSNPKKDGNAPSTFTILSYQDVLEGRVALDVLADKIALIGVMATGEPDQYGTPVGDGRAMYGVEIHANAIETLLQNKFLRYQSRFSVVLIVICLSLVSSLLWVHIKPWLGIMLAGLASLGYFLAATLAFDFYGIVPDMLYPYLAIFLTSIGGLSYRVIFEEREKRQIIRLFNSKATPQVVQQIIAAAEEGTLRMDGVQQEVTILFADIRGYTQLVADMPPRQMMLTVNEYLRIVGLALIKHEGTLNQYAGDLIMAIFNAPLKQEDHALRAVQAGLAIQKDLADFQASPRGAALPQVSFGVGICTGVVVVGNVGFEQRYDYSAVGDAVNLAFHITSAARPGQVLISDTTYQQVKDKVQADEGQIVPVKGKRKSMMAYRIFKTTLDEE